MQGLNIVTRDILSQMFVYLDKLEDDEFSKPLPLLSDASIGGHTRHVLDGFICLMNQHGSGTISYDNRQRDFRMERETSVARQTVLSIIDFVDCISPEGDCHHEIAYTDSPVRSLSSLDREIVHNIEHAIHHLAIIKIALLAYHGDIDIPKEFGVAPSTLRHWAEQKVSA